MYMYVYVLYRTVSAKQNVCPLKLVPVYVHVGRTLVNCRSILKAKMMCLCLLLTCKSKRRSVVSAVFASLCPP